MTKVIYTSDHFSNLTEGDAVYMFCDECYKSTIEKNPYTWRSEEVIEHYENDELAKSRLNDLAAGGRRHSRAGCHHHRAA